MGGTICSQVAQSVATTDAQAHGIVGVQEDQAASSNDQAAEVDAKLVWPVTRLAGGYRFEAEDGKIVWASVNVPAANLKVAMAGPAMVAQAAERLGVKHYASTSDLLNPLSNSDAAS